MIAGIGTDVVDTVHFRALLEEPGSTFLLATFTASEVTVSRSRPSRDPVPHLAARFAAKEAVIKALSQSLAPRPLPSARADLREVEIISDAEGRPSIALHGRLLALATDAGLTALHVSLSHDGPTATAFVVAER